ncbi:MAG: hypothetical protein ACRDJ5_08610 [Actinomycetota bacterium]
MGARLQYAKVIDRQLFYNRGGRIHPKLRNEVMLQDEPGRAGAFLVLRGWSDDRGACTESWRIEAPAAMVVYESTPREIHLATHSHVESLEDEIADLELEFAADDYTVIFFIDEHEVARVDFPVRVAGTPEPEA